MSHHFSDHELQLDESDTTFTSRFPSDEALVEGALAAAKSWLRARGAERTEPAIVVVRELLLNAVIHGNQRDRSKQVSCTIRKIPDGEFEICVEDEGSGFDPRSIDMGLPRDAKKIGKRGLILARSLSRSLVFDTGNARVLAYLDLQQHARHVPGQQKEDMPQMLAPDEFKRLVEYAVTCAHRYDGSASLVMMGSRKGPVTMSDVIGCSLRDCDRCTELGERVAIFMNETNRDGAENAVSRYLAAADDATDLRYGLASVPRDGEDTESLFEMAGDRLRLSQE